MTQQGSSADCTTYNCRDKMLSCHTETVRLLHGQF